MNMVMVWLKWQPLPPSLLRVVFRGRVSPLRSARYNFELNLEPNGLGVWWRYRATAIVCSVPYPVRSILIRNYTATCTNASWTAFVCIRTASCNSLTRSFCIMCSTNADATYGNHVELQAFMGLDPFIILLCSC